MITYDFTNASSERVGGHGLSERELDDARRKGEAAFSRVIADRKKGRFGFAELPYQEELVAAIEAFASKRAREFGNFVHLGIGGSSLGASALHSALCDPFHNLLPEKNRDGRPRFFFLDNVDPEEAAALFDLIDPAETIFHVVTKSGTTAETVASFLVVFDLARRSLGEKYRKHFVVTTDKTRGFLRKVAREENFDAFEIPEAVGGRFSALSPVGLLPAAFAGVPIRELTAGAIVADEICSRDEARNNPAFTAALVSRTLDAGGKPIHVLMPYCRALCGLADWFRQLWAESLGKEGRGPTPVRALGATDQHSQIQLYNEGPNDKFITFLEVENFRRETAIPAVFEDEPACRDLQGRAFSELLLAEKRGTEAALTAAARPNATIRIPEVSPRTFGALFFFFEMMTAFGGALYEVNAFDQPGVEAGKKATREFLRGAPSPAPDRRYVIS